MHDEVDIDQPPGVGEEAPAEPAAAERVDAAAVAESDLPAGPEGVAADAAGAAAGGPTRGAADFPGDGAAGDRNRDSAGSPGEALAADPDEALAADPDDSLTTDPDEGADAAPESLYPGEALAADPDESLATDPGEALAADPDEGPDEGADAAPESLYPGDALPDEELDRIVEALLFATGESLTPVRMAQAAGGVSPRRVRRSIDRLRAHYAGTLRSFDVIEIAGGFRLYSRPEYQEYVVRLEKMRAPEKLSAAALETLAIIAYRQPLVRADIDAIRGVQSGPILRSLIDRKLIRVVGRSDQPGRPLLYGTTKRFLDHFGLSSVKDLPRVEDLKAP